MCRVAGPERSDQTSGGVPRQTPNGRTGDRARRPFELQQHEEESGPELGTDPRHNGEIASERGESGRDVHQEGYGRRLEELHVRRVIGQIRSVHRGKSERIRPGFRQRVKLLLFLNVYNYIYIYRHYS